MFIRNPKQSKAPKLGREPGANGCESNLMSPGLSGLTLDSLLNVCIQHSNTYPSLVFHCYNSLALNIQLC